MATEDIEKACGRRD